MPLYGAADIAAGLLALLGEPIHRGAADPLAERPEVQTDD
jgi:hypothetical protein